MENKITIQISLSTKLFEELIIESNLGYLTFNDFIEYKLSNLIKEIKQNNDAIVKCSYCKENVKKKAFELQQELKNDTSGWIYEQTAFHCKNEYLDNLEKKVMQENPLKASLK